MKCCQNVARVPQKPRLVLCDATYCQQMTHNKPEAKHLSLFQETLVHITELEILIKQYNASVSFMEEIQLCLQFFSIRLSLVTWYGRFRHQTITEIHDDAQCFTRLNSSIIQSNITLLQEHKRT